MKIILSSQHGSLHLDYLVTTVFSGRTDVFPVVEADGDKELLHSQ